MIAPFVNREMIGILKMKQEKVNVELDGFTRRPKEATLYGVKDIL